MSSHYLYGRCYACDRDGSSLCKIDSCAQWHAKDGATPTLEKETNVPCFKNENSQCVSKIDQPTGNKTVQFGPVTVGNTAGTMFNMGRFIDSGDRITTNFRMNDLWKHPTSLLFRHIHLRLYESESSGEEMICTVYHRYGDANDGLGNMRVNVIVKGVDGQQLKWVACDDTMECPGGPSTMLKATHRMIGTHTDGWCVRALGSGRISIKYTDVQRFEGITFQLADGPEPSYFFFNGASIGMLGDVDEHGLVTNGDVPEILLNPERGCVVSKDSN